MFADDVVVLDRRQDMGSIGDIVGLHKRSPMVRLLPSLVVSCWIQPPRMVQGGVF